MQCRFFVQKLNSKSMTTSISEFTKKMLIEDKIMARLKQSESGQELKEKLRTQYLAQQ